jgi:hypothetical protein
LYINHYIQWRENKIFRDGSLLFSSKEQNPAPIIDEAYQHLGVSYPKFFKMDILSRVAFLASEFLGPDYSGMIKENIGVVLTTHSGCLEVDRKFEESRKSFASPALFVYTLPNIMLGEICIRNGFKGEQMCTIEETFNPDWFMFYVRDLLEKRTTDACLFGHVDALYTHIEVDLFWVSKVAGKKEGIIFDRENLNKITG